MGRLCPPYGPPVGSLKQPIEANPDVAVLVTEGVVGVVIDGLFFDEKGATEEIDKGELDHVSIVNEAVIDEVVRLVTTMKILKRQSHQFEWRKRSNWLEKWSLSLN